MPGFSLWVSQGQRQVSAGLRSGNRLPASLGCRQDSAACGLRTEGPGSLLGSPGHFLLLGATSTSWLVAVVHLQSQQRWACPCFMHFSGLCLVGSRWRKLSVFQGSYDYTGPTRIIQDNLLISKPLALIPSAWCLAPCSLTFTGVTPGTKVLPAMPAFPGCQVTWPCKVDLYGGRCGPELPQGRCALCHYASGAQEVAAAPPHCTGGETEAQARGGVPSAKELGGPPGTVAQGPCDRVSRRENAAWARVSEHPELRNGRT